MKIIKAIKDWHLRVLAVAVDFFLGYLALLYVGALLYGAVRLVIWLLSPKF